MQGHHPNDAMSHQNRHHSVVMTSLVCIVSEILLFFDRYVTTCDLISYMTRTFLIHVKMSPS